MAKWKKRFELWATARQPVSVKEVESIIHKVFGDRVGERTGTSHRWAVDVPELVNGDDDYRFGFFGIPVKSGKVVLPIYCQIAYEAARQLGLPEEKENEQ